jgi:hypothetical protein
MEVCSVSYNGGKVLPLLFGCGLGYVSGNTYVFGITNNAFKVFTNSASFYGGVASYATNIVAAASSAGYTNKTLGINMVANISGTSGTYVFYNRSGGGGATVCGIPLFTNTVTPYGRTINIPVNCGIQVVNGSGVAIQAYAQ